MLILNFFSSSVSSDSVYSDFLSSPLRNSVWLYHWVDFWWNHPILLCVEACNKFKRQNCHYSPSYFFMWTSLFTCTWILYVWNRFGLIVVVLHSSEVLICWSWCNVLLRGDDMLFSADVFLLLLMSSLYLVILFINFATTDSSLYFLWNERS